MNIHAKTLARLAFGKATTVTGSATMAALFSRSHDADKAQAALLRVNAKHVRKADALIVSIA
jgi:hypothetical protein